MKNFNMKIGVLALAVSLGTFVSCQQETNELLSEEEFSSIKEKELLANGCSASNPKAKNYTGTSNCTPGKADPCTRDVDLASPVNTGTVDDRTCHQDYYELTKFGKTYGNYRIAVNSNHWDTPNTLQPRIERSYPRANSNIGSKFTFTGKFIIERVGTTTSSGTAGTYIAQTKGKYNASGSSPGSGSKDPAICLYLAKKGAIVNGVQTFDIYAERIKNVRSTSGGREVVYLTTINKGEENDFEVRMGFRTVNGAKQHYCNVFINGTPYYWNVPEPDRGTQSGFRYGAYRCKGGSAHIRWANTVYNRVNN